MTDETDRATGESEIRQLVERWTQAVRDKDLHEIMSVYAPDIVWFDALPPLHYVGAASRKSLWEQCLVSYQGPIGCEIRDLSVTVRDDVAFSHSLNRFIGTITTGQKLDFWVRWTACFRKIDGKWLITHEHVSVPFDPESGKALIDLKP